MALIATLDACVRVVCRAAAGKTLLVCEIAGVGGGVR